MPGRDTGNRYNGILNVAKPVGMTSHDVVDRVRRAAGMRRVGHAGTLDPAAEGVLLVCLGVATRVTDYLMDGVKVYRGTVHFGATSTTDDREGIIITTSSPPSLTRSDIEAAVPRFVGEVDQVPPRYAAVKVAGQPLYQRARAGESFEVEARRVRIDRIDVLSWNPPEAVIEVQCSKGTYIRSIARDLGPALGTGAYLSALCRISSGPFSLTDSIGLDEIARSAASGYLDRLLYPLEESVNTWPLVVLSASQASLIAHGAPITDLSINVPLVECRGIRAYNTGGALVALLKYRDQTTSWFPDKVFPSGEGDGLA